MKKKRTPRPARHSDVSHAIICALCVKKIKLLQKKNWFVLTRGKQQIKIDYWKLLKITVEENYCYFYVQHSKALKRVERYGIRSTLVSWKHLEEMGLVQVTHQCILNLAHVIMVENYELFSKYLEGGIEVTEGNKELVAKLLPIWSGLSLG